MALVSDSQSDIELSIVNWSELGIAPHEVLDRRGDQPRASRAIGGDARGTTSP